MKHSVLTNPQCEISHSQQANSKPSLFQEGPFSTEVILALFVPGHNNRKTVINLQIALDFWSIV